MRYPVQLCSASVKQCGKNAGAYLALSLRVGTENIYAVADIVQLIAAVLCFILIVKYGEYYGTAAGHKLAESAAFLHFLFYRGQLRLIGQLLETVIHFSGKLLYAAAAYGSDNAVGAFRYLISHSVGTLVSLACRYPESGADGNYSAVRHIRQGRKYIAYTRSGHRAAVNTEGYISADLLGCVLPIPEADQKELFKSMVEQTLGRSCNFENVKNLNDAVSDLIEQNKDTGEPVQIEKEQMRRLLSENGADQSVLSDFDAAYDEAVGQGVPLMAENLIDTSKLEVKSPSMKISVKADMSDMLKTRVIDGMEYLLIPVTDELEVNGIRILQSEK